MSKSFPFLEFTCIFQSAVNDGNHQYQSMDFHQNLTQPNLSERNAVEYGLTRKISLVLEK
jgi:hypothetical protein